MQSLKDSMKWDEQTYGREYDLDVYHIVAVDDFNMGAMENKGLNVFNTAGRVSDMAPHTHSTIAHTSRSSLHRRASSRSRRPRPTATTAASRASSPTSTSTTGAATA